eukprot:scpid104140/ scgid10601/ 
MAGSDPWVVDWPTRVPFPTSHSLASTSSGAPTQAMHSAVMPASAGNSLPIPVWPPVLRVNCKELGGELHLFKLYGTNSTLDGNVQSLHLEGVWMTPREFEALAGFGDPENWKCRILFNGRPLSEVFSDIEKAFQLGFPRAMVFSGKVPPLANPSYSWARSISTPGNLLNSQPSLCLQLPPVSPMLMQPYDRGDATGMVPFAPASSPVTPAAVTPVTSSRPSPKPSSRRNRRRSAPT